MADWAVVAELGTAVGTLVLAAATFASVRSGNRSARVAEQSRLESMRPLVLPSQLDDPPVKVGFGDEHWVDVPGGHAVADAQDDVVYVAASVRNVGRGLAVLRGWRPVPGRETGPVDQPDPDSFRRLTLDLYVAPDQPGFLEGALRDPSEPVFDAVAEVVRRRDLLTVDLLYGDEDGGQRMITRFLLSPLPETGWIIRVVHHWNVDRADPR